MFVSDAENIGCKVPQLQARVLRWVRDVNAWIVDDTGWAIAMLETPQDNQCLRTYSLCLPIYPHPRHP
jgi:hypothetical protein